MLSRRRGRARKAFTLVEVVIALVILAMLAAVIISSVTGRLRQGRTAALGETLASLSAAIFEYRADVRRYPTNLRYMTTAPTAGVVDLCARSVPTAFLSAWRGPYLKNAFLPSGMPIQEMTVSDTLEMSPAGPYTVDTSGLLILVTRNVDAEIAAALEAQFDGNNDLAAGTIRFTPTASGKGTLRFAVPVRGC